MNYVLEDMGKLPLVDGLNEASDKELWLGWT